jgi:hypothetical protein
MYACVQLICCCYQTTGNTDAMNNVYSGITSLSLDLSSSGLKKKRSSQSIKSNNAQNRSRRSSTANNDGNSNSTSNSIAPTIPKSLSLLHHMDDISVSSDANNSDTNKQQQHHLLALDVGVSDAR